MSHTKGELHRHDLEIHIERSENGKVVEHTCIADMNECSQLDNESNAKELVRRWNSQPNLLEACEEAQKVFGFIAENYKSAPHFPNAERLVDAAIAKAQSKQ